LPLPTIVFFGRLTAPLSRRSPSRSTALRSRRHLRSSALRRFAQAPVTVSTAADRLSAIASGKISAVLPRSR
jgi:hypothetical protein